MSDSISSLASELTSSTITSESMDTPLSPKYFSILPNSSFAMASNKYSPSLNITFMSKLLAVFTERSTLKNRTFNILLRLISTILGAKIKTVSKGNRYPSSARDEHLILWSPLEVKGTLFTACVLVRVSRISVRTSWLGATYSSLSFGNLRAAFSDSLSLTEMTSSESSTCTTTCW